MKTRSLSKTNSISYYSSLSLQHRRVEHVVWEMRRAGFSQQLFDFILSFYYIQTVPRQITTHSVLTVQSRNLEDPSGCAGHGEICYVLIGWPLPHAISSALRDIWSSKNVIKLENVISVSAVYILSEEGLAGIFSQGNNKRTSGWTLSPARRDKINRHRAVFTQRGHSFPKVSFCWISLNGKGALGKSHHGRTGRQ